MSKLEAWYVHEFAGNGAFAVKSSRRRGTEDHMFGGCMENCCKSYSNNELREIARQLMKELQDIPVDDRPLEFVEMYNELVDVIYKRTSWIMMKFGDTKKIVKIQVGDEVFVPEKKDGSLLITDNSKIYIVEKSAPYMTISEGDTVQVSWDGGSQLGFFKVGKITGGQAIKCGDDFILRKV